MTAVALGAALLWTAGVMIAGGVWAGRPWPLRDRGRSDA